jgi:hypothetical protein
MISNSYVGRVHILAQYPAMVLAPQSVKSTSYETGKEHKYLYIFEPAIPHGDTAVNPESDPMEEWLRHVQP